MSDNEMRWRVSWDITLIPRGYTVTLFDGQEVEGPVVLETPPEVEQVASESHDA